MFENSGITQTNLGIARSTRFFSGLLEDKIVQHAVGTVLNQIYEEDFLGFSYGFRPGRRQHDALDALWMGIMRKKVNWVLDADIRDFLDRVPQCPLIHEITPVDRPRL